VRHQLADIVLEPIFEAIQPFTAPSATCAAIAIALLAAAFGRFPATFRATAPARFSWAMVLWFFYAAHGVLLFDRCRQPDPTECRGPG
jgi:hypothetical protein